MKNLSEVRVEDLLDFMSWYGDEMEMMASDMGYYLIIPGYTDGTDILRSFRAEARKNGINRPYLSSVLNRLILAEAAVYLLEFSDKPDCINALQEALSLPEDPEGKKFSKAVLEMIEEDGRNGIEITQEMFDATASVSLNPENTPLQLINVMLGLFKPLFHVEA